MSAPEESCSSISRRRRKSPRHGRYSGRCSKRRPSRRKLAKQAEKDAKKNVKELNKLSKAQARQTSLQTVRMTVVSLQFLTMLVALAAFISAMFDAFDDILFYTTALLVQIYLESLGITLCYLYEHWLRWLFWLSLQAVMLAEGALLFYFAMKNSGSEISSNCKENKLTDKCSKITGVSLIVHVYALLCFQILMHSLVMILSLRWRECHDGSLDQLMESEKGRRIIAKHLARNTAAEAETQSEKAEERLKTDMDDLRQTSDEIHKVADSMGSESVALDMEENEHADLTSDASMNAAISAEQREP